MKFYHISFVDSLFGRAGYMEIQKAFGPLEIIIKCFAISKIQVFGDPREMWHCS